jgi:hypothetical protein
MPKIEYTTTRHTTVTRATSPAATPKGKRKAILEILGDSDTVLVDALVPRWMALQWQALVNLHNK